MKHSEISGIQYDLVSETGESPIPKLSPVQPVDDEKVKQYLKDLQKFFITGEKTGEGLPQKVYPVRFATYIKGDIGSYNYPVFYRPENDAFISLYDILVNLVEKNFNEESTVIIRSALPEFLTTIQEKFTATYAYNDESIIEEITTAIRSLDVDQKTTDEFYTGIKNLQNELLKQAKYILGFNERTVFQILNLQNKLRRKFQIEFLKSIRETISGLRELQRLDSGGTDSSLGEMDFAEDLISLDKIRDVTIDAMSSHLSKANLNRLKQALQTLISSEKSFSQKTMTIIASHQVVQSFDLEHIFDNATIQVATGGSCRQAREQSKKDLHDFVKTIAALQIGNLMIEQRYIDHLHDSYFDHFDLTYISNADLQFVPSTIVIDDSRQLMDQANDFLALLTDKSFVKILGVNRLSELSNLEDTEESDFLELASLAICRRTSYVFQGSIDQPSRLNGSFKKGLDFQGSVFWNILIPPFEKNIHFADYFALSAAIESRYFPRIEYEPNENTFANSRMEIDHNPSSEASLATYQLKIKSKSVVSDNTYSYTIPEFLAMNSRLKKELEIIPPIYQSDNLIPVSEYLSLCKDEKFGKIPYIWVVDDHNELKQCAVPVSWIQMCRNRLEYWNFLQSMAGISQVQLQTRIEELRSEWEQAKQSELEALTLTLNEQFEKDRNDILTQGITRMLCGLLKEDSLEGTLLQMSKVDFQLKEDARTNKKTLVDSSVKKEKKDKEIKPSIDKAWVESSECTSCEDCIVAVPSVFKYNDNKQAYIFNPKGGTFAQIVRAAEKCPARCIHPGIPQNENEPSLDKWMKRAEKFN